MISDIFGKDQQPPPAPDYTGAAIATAAGNADAARIAAKANRINQNTPYGTITYTPGANGDQDQWTSNISLTPAGQALLDRQNQASLYYGDQAIQGLQRVGQSLSKPFDYGSVGDVENAAYSTQTARLDPQFQRSEDQLRTRLANQGLPVGSEAWNAEMKNFNQAKNDAYTQARTAAISLAPQTYQLAAALREQPLNEVNALRTGSQVTNPTFTPPGSQQTVQGPDYLRAAGLQGQYDQNSYNQQVAQQNAGMQGLFSIGSAVAGSPWFGKMIA